MFTELPEKLKQAGRLAALISPHLTVEEAYLLCKYLRSLDNEAMLAVGPVVTEGQDEKFPNGFTILAEKAPNRRGVESVVAFFAGKLTPWDEFLNELEPAGVKAVWVTGGYKSDWIDEGAAARLASVETLIVQDIFPSAVTQQATYVLPGAAFAERGGSYVNHADRLQSVQWAVRPPAGARVEGGVYWRLLGEQGLYRASPVLEELSAAIPFFAAASGPIPDVGVDLRVNQLA